VTTRFTKKVFNAEDGLRTLGFYVPGNTKPFLAFNINVLEDMRIEVGDVATARQVAGAIQAFLKIELTPEEIEFAVEDI
jgi:hypothetical protein